MRLLVTPFSLIGHLLCITMCISTPVATAKIPLAPSASIRILPMGGLRCTHFFPRMDFLVEKIFSLPATSETAFIVETMFTRQSRCTVVRTLLPQRFLRQLCHLLLRPRRNLPPSLRLDHRHCQAMCPLSLKAPRPPRYRLLRLTSLQSAPHQQPRRRPQCSPLAPPLGPPVHQRRSLA